MKETKKAIANKAQEKISLNKLAPEHARKNFKALLQANPNFFGNVAKSKFKAAMNIAGDTTYEELACVGFQPQFNRLEGVVYLKQSGGYSGDICSSGSQEYVRFYLSYDNGATWEDQGLTSFTAYEVAHDQPLEFDVTLQINPSQSFCFFQNLPKVRAILSWNQVPDPNTPNFTPVWGNVVEANIQIAPGYLYELSSVLAEAKLTLPEKLAAAIDSTAKIPAPAPKKLEAAELFKLYSGKNVPPHRFLFSGTQGLMNISALQAAAQAPVKAAKGGSAISKFLDINLEEILEILLNTFGDTTYEELDCIGLNTNTDQMVGTINVKLSSGYSGGLCTAGSQEYVAFWMDFGSGWEYQGTTAVNTHDINPMPAGGLQYSAFLPVDITSHRKPCGDGPVTARVRAVLSWNAAPDPNDPYAPPTWGNAQETLVLITPGAGSSTLPFLSSVGDIAQNLIAGSGRITDAVAIHTGGHFVDAPFGGRISLAGHVPNPTAGMKYRVVKKPQGTSDTSYVPIVNEPGGLTLTVNVFSGGVWTQSEQTFHADVDGYYPYQDYASTHSVEGSILGYWYSTLAEDSHAFDLRIDLSTDGIPAHDLHSNVVTVLVDNTAPVALLDLNLMGADCAFFAPGTVFSGNYTATDDDFGQFSFVIRPAGPAHGVLPTPPSGSSVQYSGAINDPGVVSTYSLNTAKMDQCGYSLTLQVWDRTNVNSGAGNNYNEASVGFCLWQIIA